MLLQTVMKKEKDLRFGEGGSAGLSSLVRSQGAGDAEPTRQQSGQVPALLWCSIRSCHLSSGLQHLILQLAWIAAVLRSISTGRSSRVMYRRVSWPCTLLSRVNRQLVFKMLHN